LHEPMRSPYLRIDLKLPDLQTHTLQDWSLYHEMINQEMYLEKLRNEAAAKK